jgi:hypothetical protein
MVHWFVEIVNALRTQTRVIGSLLWRYSVVWKKTQPT